MKAPQIIGRFIFYSLAIIAIFFLLLGAIFLVRKDKSSLAKVLDILTKELEELKEKEPMTIEDEIFNACCNVSKANYDKGTNEDLSIECRMCGENTKRGEYYKRIDCIDPDAELPYLFICKDCYNKCFELKD